MSTWENAFPTKPGLYWYKDDPMAVPIVMELRREDELVAYRTGDETDQYVSPNGWWADAEPPSFDARFAGL